MSDWMIFAERLSEQMKKQNLSIRQLAERMDMTPTTIFRYAKGQRVPRANEILKASDVLGVTCDYLIGLSDDPKKASRPSAQPNLRPACDKLAIDCISRQAAIDALANTKDLVDVTWTDENDNVIDSIEEKRNIIANWLEKVPPAQPDNQTNLCDSCDYSYPDCPSKNDDVIFGNGIGNDNICACNKYKPSAQPEIKPMDYQDCANAMLRMWMDGVVTDGEYNRIMDKLNAFWRTRNERSD